MRGVPRLPPLTESELQSKVIALAKLCQWRVVHIRPTEIAKGRWATPYQGDKGLPDLVLARDGRVILVELKTVNGRASLDQKAWLAAAGVNGYLWDERDWHQIEFTLKRRRAA
jgi:hypothetical protein